MGKRRNAELGDQAERCHQQRYGRAETRDQDAEQGQKRSEHEDQIEKSEADGCDDGARHVADCGIGLRLMNAVPRQQLTGYQLGAAQSFGNLMLILAFLDSVQKVFRVIGQNVQSFLVRQFA